MKKFDLTKYKELAEDQPVVLLGLSAAILQGAAKLMDANTKRKNSNTWKREVNRRSKK